MIVADLFENADAFRETPPDDDYYHRHIMSLQHEYLKLVEYIEKAVEKGTLERIPKNIATNAITYGKWYPGYGTSKQYSAEAKKIAKVFQRIEVISEELKSFESKGKLTNAARMNNAALLRALLTFISVHAHELGDQNTREYDLGVWTGEGFLLNYSEYHYNTQANVRKLYTNVYADENQEYWVNNTTRIVPHEQEVVDQLKRWHAEVQQITRKLEQVEDGN